MSASKLKRNILAEELPDLKIGEFVLMGLPKGKIWIWRSVGEGMETT